MKQIFKNINNDKAHEFFKKIFDPLYNFFSLKSF